MHYYQRHIGDYIGATAGLNMLQDGAYSRLLDHIYQSEAPLPANRKMLYTMVRAMTAAERKAVDHVLDIYFTLGDAGYTQKRAMREIARFRDKIALARRSANWRWEKQRGEQDTPCQIDASGYAVAYAEGRANTMQAACERNATHKPITNIHKPVNTPSPASSGEPAREAASIEGDGGGCSAFEIAKTLIDAGVPTHEADPRVRKLADDGTDIGVIAAACTEAQRSRPDETIGLPYVLGVLRRWSSEAKNIDVSHAAAPKTESKPADKWWDSNAGIERKGRELGMYARGTESHGDFKERLFAEIDKRKVLQ